MNQCLFCLEGLNKFFIYCVEEKGEIVVDSDNFFVTPN